MNSQQFKKINSKGKSTSYGAGLPNKPGVYFFLLSARQGLVENNILYIGKATSLKDRVKSYFGKDIINTRGPHIVKMVEEATSVKWQETDSVLEALILEANLIKKYQPKYNTKEKDNKSFNYVCITDELIPKVIVVREKNIKINRKQKVASSKENLKYQSIYGPFPNGAQLKEAMKIIRRIFPYVDDQSSKKNNKEFYKQLGLIPNIKSSQPPLIRGGGLGSPHRILSEARVDHFEKEFSASLLEYKKNIKNLKLFFEGKKKSIINNFKKEMIFFAKKKEFEKAGEIKKKIFALEHINDISLLKSEIFGSPTSEYRIEAYDIAHMGGENMVGVMTVIEDGELNKREYKKFIIKTQNKANDTGALKEVLSRRFRHLEWNLPQLIVVDGSTAQINVVKKIIKELSEQNITSQKDAFRKVLGREGREPGPDHFQKHLFAPSIVAVVKDDKHKAKAIMGDENIIKKYKKDILLINSEAHRFAITFHKQRRNKNFLL